MITVYYKDTKGNKVLLASAYDNNVDLFADAGERKKFFEQVPKNNYDQNIYIKLDGQEYRFRRDAEKELSQDNERRYKLTVFGCDPITVNAEMKDALEKIWKGNSFSVESGPYVEPWS